MTHQFQGYHDIVHSSEVRAMMRTGKILRHDQEMSDVLTLLQEHLVEAEGRFRTSVPEAREFALGFKRLIEAGVCILGSPLLTNIASNQPTFASCTAVPCLLGSGNAAVSKQAEPYYQLNMGSGFDLTNSEDPVATLTHLNTHASWRTALASYDRYIGNIAHIDVRHPKILEFVDAKVENQDLRHFNISVNIDEPFFSAVENDQSVELLDGTVLQAQTIWSRIVEAAWTCGDPGIISLERYNKTNSVEATSPYITTAPCAEAGLAEGETCVFGYINLAACVALGRTRLDFQLLETAAATLVRVLDDTLELSIGNFPTDLSNTIMRDNRKIGVGICGYSDALLLLGLNYGSDEACDLLREALSVINYSTKIASHALAIQRGPFPNFVHSKFFSSEEFLARFAQHSRRVTANQWRDLARTVRKLGIRNAMTMALPPSGRSSLALGVNSSIEPILQRYDTGNRSLPIVAARESVRDVSEFNRLTRTAIELSPDEHLCVVVTASGLLDDGVSKTINLPSTASIHDVSNVYRNAWIHGLKAISVYRNGSKK